MSTSSLASPQESLDLELNKRWSLDAGKSFSIPSRDKRGFFKRDSHRVAWHLLSLWVWASEGSPCLAQAPRKEKAESASAVAGPDVCLSTFYCHPRGLGPGQRLRERPRPHPHPQGHRLSAACPADSAPPTRAGEGAGRGEAWYKGPPPSPRAASPFPSAQRSTHPPGEYSELGRGLFGQGGRDGKSC